MKKSILIASSGILIAAIILKFKKEKWYSLDENNVTIKVTHEDIP